jgi:hypothetical protein
MLIKYNVNSGQHVQYTEQLRQLFTDRFVDLNQNRTLFRTSANPFEASYEGVAPIL